MDLRYTYDTEQRYRYQEIITKVPKQEKSVCVREVDNGIILPAIPDSKLYWGMGGVVSDNKIIQESIVPGAFGGKYEYDEDSLEFNDEVILFSGVMPLHWGHFIIDYLSRLWDVSQYEMHKIAYIPWLYGSNIDGNIKTCLDYLGITDRLVPIIKPTRFRKVIVAAPAMSFAWEFDSEKFQSVVNKIKKKLYLMLRVWGCKK